MYQKIIQVGNLGSDPELRYTQSGKAVCNFSMAVNLRDKTSWYRVSTWEKLAEACKEYLHKGSKVLVEGELDFDPGTGNPKMYTRKDGETSTVFEVTAIKVVFLSNYGDGKDASEDPHDEDDFENEIPF